MKRPNSLEKTLMLGKIEGRRKRGQHRVTWLDGITDLMTWVWASSESWWWTGKPGVLQSVGSKRVRCDWETELNWETNVNKNTSMQNLWDAAKTVLKRWFIGIPKFLNKIRRISNEQPNLPSKTVRGTSLVVQWLRLCTPNTEGVGPISGWGIRSLMPCSVANTKKKSN